MLVVQTITEINPKTFNNNLKTQICNYKHTNNLTVSANPTRIFFLSKNSAFMNFSHTVLYIHIYIFPYCSRGKQWQNWFLFRVECIFKCTYWIKQFLQTIPPVFFTNYSTVLYIFWTRIVVHKFRTVLNTTNISSVGMSTLV